MKDPTSFRRSGIDGSRQAVTLSADEALEQKSGVASPEKDRAVEWLRQTLADGEMPTTEVERLAREEEISRDTLCRAKKELAAVCYPVKDAAGKRRWFVKLPVKKHP